MFGVKKKAFKVAGELVVLIVIRKLRHLKRVTNKAGVWLKE
jgi:hypothetical protein